MKAVSFVFDAKHCDRCGRPIGNVGYTDHSDTVICGRCYGYLKGYYPNITDPAESEGRL